MLRLGFAQEIGNLTTKAAKEKHKKHKKEFLFVPFVVFFCAFCVLFPNCKRLPARAEHSVPPHDRTGQKHCGRSQSENGPYRLCGLVAEAGAAARNPDSVNTAEMQIGEPINDLIANACAGIRGSERLELVGEVLKRLGNAEVDAAYGKYRYESEAP